MILNAAKSSSTKDVVQTEAQRARVPRATSARWNSGSFDAARG